MKILRPLLLLQAQINRSDPRMLGSGDRRISLISRASWSRGMRPTHPRDRCGRLPIRSPWSTPAQALSRRLPPDLPQASIRVTCDALRCLTPSSPSIVVIRFQMFLHHFRPMPSGTGDGEHGRWRAANFP